MNPLPPIPKVNRGDIDGVASRLHPSPALTGMVRAIAAKERRDVAHNIAILNAIAPAPI